jgi:hypothetical protein
MMGNGPVWAYLNRAVLVDFSEGRISRHQAMHRLGDICYIELLDRIAAAGLTLPQVSEAEAKRTATKMWSVLDGSCDAGSPKDPDRSDC